MSTNNNLFFKFIKLYHQHKAIIKKIIHYLIIILSIFAGIKFVFNITTGNIYIGCNHNIENKKVIEDVPDRVTKNQEDNERVLYYFGKNIQVKYVSGAIAKNIQFKICKNTYDTGEKGSFELADEDRFERCSNNIIIEDNNNHIVDIKQDLIIINMLPDDLTIVDPQDNENIQSFDSQYIKIELTYDGKPIPIDKKLNKSIGLELYNKDKYYEKWNIERTKNLHIFKLSLQDNPSGRLQVIPYLELGTTKRIHSSTPSVFYTIRRLQPKILGELFQHPNKEHMITINDKYITYTPQSYAPLVTKIIEKSKLSEKHYIEIVFSLQTNNSFIAINISGMQFKFVRNYRYFYESTTANNFYIEKAKNKQLELYRSITSDRFNKITISSDVKENFIYFNIYLECDGETYPPLPPIKFMINTNFLNQEAPLEIECGIDKPKKKGKISIKRIDVY